MFRTVLRSETLVHFTVIYICPIPNVGQIFYSEYFVTAHSKIVKAQNMVDGEKYTKNINGKRKLKNEDACILWYGVYVPKQCLIK
jgi:hypothetical protein